MVELAWTPSATGGKRNATVGRVHSQCDPQARTVLAAGLATEGCLTVQFATQQLIRPGDVIDHCISSWNRHSIDLLIPTHPNWY